MESGLGKFHSVPAVTFLGHDVHCAYQRRAVPYSEHFFNFKNAMFILARYVYFVLYTKLENV